MSEILRHDAVAAAAFADVDFNQTNLVSDLSAQAADLDTNLVNPWGIAIAPNHPVWIAGNGSGLSTIYNGAGKCPTTVVAIAPPNGGTSAAPIGITFNGTTAFGSNSFLFATEDGTISVWNGGNSSTLEVDNSPPAHSMILRVIRC